MQTDVADHYPVRSAFEARIRRLVPVVVDAATGETAFTAGVEGDEAGVLSPEFGGDPTPGNGGSGRDAAWSPDGRFLATSTVDGTVVVSNATTGSRRFAIEAHTAPVNALAWSPDSARLATASDDGTARVTEIAADGGGATTSVVAHDTDRGLVSVAFSPGGDRIVTGVSGRTAVKVWDIGVTGGAEWLNVAGHSARPGASALAFTPDGDALVVGGEDGTIASWDVTSGRRLWTSSPVTAERREVEQLAVSPDGLLVASAVDEGPVELWDVSTGGHLRTVLDRLASQRVVSLTWSHDGEVLAVARTYDLEGRVDIVNRAGGRVSDFYENSHWGIGSASFSPDDRLLVTTRLPSLDNLPRQGLRVWDWERGETVKTIEAPAVQAAFDPRSPRIAARLEQEGTVGVWDAVSGDQLETLPGPAVVNALAYGSDGSQVATAGVDGVVRLWDPDTGEQDLELRGHGTNVQAVVFSPDGTRLASVGNDGLVRVWALELDDLISIAEQRLTRALHRRGVPAVPRSGPVPGRLIRTATQLPHRCCATATTLLHRRVRQQLHTAARHEGAVMALTEERIQVKETAKPTSSLPPEATRDWSPMWLLILVGAVAAVIVTVLALRPDSEADIPNHQQVIEHGSPTAVDHAAEVVIPNHQQVIEHGSPTAVDHAASTGGPVTGDHQQVIEHGSPTAVDHAASTGGPVTGDHQQVIEHGSPTAVDHAASS